MGERSGPVALLLLKRLRDFLARARATFGGLLTFAAELFAAFAPRRRSGRVRPWLVVRKGRAANGDQPLPAREEDVRRLLERMRDLEDTDSLSERAVGFAGTGADYFARPERVEQVVVSLARQNPPFLHIAREQPSESEGDSRELRTELLIRESDVLVTEPQVLLVPQFGVHCLESRRPPGYPITRAARSLSDLHLAPLLYQAQPEEWLIARLVEGAIPLLAYREERKLLIFKPETRIIQRTEHRQTRVPVEIETGGEGHSERLMYMLFDRSTSLVRNCIPRGIHAVMELAIAVAMVRSDLGRPHARYYFRSFAERLDPLPKDPPMVAESVADKDSLVRRLFRTNFSGEATNVVEALETAADDIERMMAERGNDHPVKPRIGLLTDGRATLYRNVGVRLKKLGIELDTVLIGREAARNPELMRISSTVSIVDPALYGAAA